MILFKIIIVAMAIVLPLGDAQASERVPGMNNTTTDVFIHDPISISYLFNWFV